MQNMINFNKVKTYPIKERINKVKKEDFARPAKRGTSFAGFYDSLPRILAAEDLKAVVKDIAGAYEKQKPVIFMMGAHVIKCGLNPLIIDLIKRNIIKCVALNGAGMIHDFEIALIGQTSEDVAMNIEKGKFGMARETSVYLNDAIKKGVKKNKGIGYSVGEMIYKKNLPNKELSILYWCYKKNIPATIHVAIGTDIIHQTPYCDGAATGKGSLLDFRRFTEVVSKIGGGGVVLNIGSDVILPELFLKALTVARNLGFKVRNFTTANFDKETKYRPMQNVVKRPVLSGGKGYSITGHHEIMVPLLAQAVIENI